MRSLRIDTSKTKRKISETLILSFAWATRRTKILSLSTTRAKVKTFTSSLPSAHTSSRPLTLSSTLTRLIWPRKMRMPRFLPHSPTRRSCRLVLRTTSTIWTLSLSLDALTSLSRALWASRWRLLTMDLFLATSLRSTKSRSKTTWGLDKSTERQKCPQIYCQSKSSKACLTTHPKRCSF